MPILLLSICSIFQRLNWLNYIPLWLWFPDVQWDVSSNHNACLVTAFILPKSCARREDSCTWTLFLLSGTWGGTIGILILASFHLLCAPVRSLFNGWFCDFLVCLLLDGPHFINHIFLYWNHITYLPLASFKLTILSLLLSGIPVLQTVPTNRDVGNLPKEIKLSFSFSSRQQVDRYICLCFGSLHSELSRFQTFPLSSVPRANLWRLISLLICKMSRFEFYPLHFLLVTYW